MGKLFVIHARDVSVAVILRPGPSRWFHVISWNTQTDEMEHGAWIKGRIYPENCDLSFDGKLFVYFVLKEGHREHDLPNSWTALSRPPWLSALALWPLGDSYDGGGRFTGHRQLAIRPFTKDVCHPDFPNTYVKLDRNNRPHLHCSSNIVANAFWSGYDLKGDVICTMGDRVLRIKNGGDPKEIANFSGLMPNPQPAPDWARSFP